MFSSGYNIGAARVAALAEAADGPTAGAIAALARQHRLAILYGYPEHNPEGAPFNAAQLIDRDGQCRHNYRKTHLYGDLDRQQFSASDSPSALFELNGWKLGILICFDVEFPEAVRSLALAGADLVLVPTANMLPYEFVCDVLVPCRAYENQVFLAYANFDGAEGELTYCGKSCVVAPDGQVIARAGQPEELLIADLEPERLALAREGFSYVHLRRPVLYRS
ncbi:MAG: (R)-stereoselective amidase [Pseudomonas citronellolis]|nr:MAG: (R)-stereoselective amidase [Pseudomonas citronellolis]